MPIPGTGQGQTTPQMFAELLARMVTPEVIDGVKQALRDVPTKLYDVFRQTASGPVKQQVSLPQALTEVTDMLKINNELQRCQIQVMVDLKRELEENRKLGQKMLKFQKQKDIEDEE